MDPKAYVAPAGLLRERIILITGASDGIGRALAIECARLGAQVIIHGRNQAKLEKVHDEIVAIEDVARPSIAVMDLLEAQSEAYESRWLKNWATNSSAWNTTPACSGSAIRSSSSISSAGRK